MSKFDISQVSDFQRLTLGPIAGILQSLSLLGRDPDKWDIQEGSYNGVLFHVFTSKTPYQAELPQISDHGGRRKVKFMYPYRDGQTTDDLGRAPSTFDVDILFHGPRYMEGFKALFKEINKPTPGDLLHPVRGKIKCVPETHEIIHKHDQRFALEMRITFIEHNFTIGDLRSLKDSSVKGALAQALDVFNTINNAITNVVGAITFGLALKNTITGLLSGYSDDYGLLLANLNSIFNTRGSSDIPGLLPVFDGGLVNPDGSRTGNTFPTVTSPSDILSQAPVNTTPTSIQVTQSTKDVIALRVQLEEVLTLMKSGNNGQGAVELYDDILALKESAILMQNVLETGIASSRSQVVDYVTPRMMTLREVAFANGLNPSRVTELDLLNPALDSINAIDAGTTVRVPLS